MKRLLFALVLAAGCNGQPGPGNDLCASHSGETCLELHVDVQPQEQTCFAQLILSSVELHLGQVRTPPNPNGNAFCLPVRVAILPEPGFTGPFRLDGSIEYDEPTKTDIIASGSVPGMVNMPGEHQVVNLTVIRIGGSSDGGTDGGGLDDGGTDGGSADGGGGNIHFGAEKVVKFSTTGGDMLGGLLLGPISGPGPNKLDIVVGRMSTKVTTLLNMGGFSFAVPVDSATPGIQLTKMAFVHDSGMGSPPSLIVMQPSMSLVGYMKYMSNGAYMAASQTAVPNLMGQAVAVTGAMVNGDSLEDLVFALNTVPPRVTAVVTMSPGNFQSAIASSAVSGQFGTPWNIATLHSGALSDVVIADDAGNVVGYRNMAAAGAFAPSPALTVLGMSPAAAPGGGLVSGTLFSSSMGDVALFGMLPKVVALIGPVDALKAQGSFDLSMVGATLKPTCIAIGDFDRDKREDLAIGTDSPPSIVVLRNSLSGFTLAQQIPVANTPFFLQVGDLDGNPGPEIVWMAFVDDSVHILPNTTP
jgi:hypothetical protein